MVNRRPVPKNTSKEVPEKTQVDFSDKAARGEFIKVRLESIFSDVSDNYGNFLAGELQKRLEYTIRVFHEDISELLNEMAAANELQIKMNDELRQGKSFDELVPGWKPVVHHSPEAEADIIKPTMDESEASDGNKTLFMPKIHSELGE